MDTQMYSQNGKNKNGGQTMVGRKRDQGVFIRMSVEERADLELLCDLHEKGMSEMIRWLVEQELRDPQEQRTESLTRAVELLQAVLDDVDARSPSFLRIGGQIDDEEE